MAERDFLEESTRVRVSGDGHRGDDGAGRRTSGMWTVEKR